MIVTLKGNALVPLVLFLIAVIGEALFLYLLSVSLNSSAASICIYTGCILLFSALICWLWFGEIRSKATEAVLSENSISVRGIYGFGKEKVYSFADFDGYELCFLPSSAGYYEYLYLIVNGKRKITFSEYYHNDYPQLKEYINDHISLLGEVPFNMRDEIKNIFP